jgi:hypothetical protein
VYPFAQTSPAGRNVVSVTLLDESVAAAQKPSSSVLLREANDGGFAIDADVPLAPGVEHTFRFSTPTARDAVVVRARSLHCVPTSSRGETPRYVIWFAFPRHTPEDLHVISQIAAMIGWAADA